MCYPESAKRPDLDHLQSGNDEGWTRRRFREMFVVTSHGVPSVNSVWELIGYPVVTDFSRADLRDPGSHFFPQFLQPFLADRDRGLEFLGEQ